jgi:hypothetical protein
MHGLLPDDTAIIHHMRMLKKKQKIVEAGGEDLTAAKGIGP